MEADRNSSLDDITEPHQLKNQKGILLKSDTAPSLAFFNARVWLAYKTREGHITVGVRIKRDPENITYEEYDLNTTFRDKGTSDEPPCLIEFQGKLFIFWKRPSEDSGKKGKIVYTSTEDGTEWAKPVYVSNYQTLAAPSVVTLGGRLYVAYLLDEQPKPGRIGTFSTGDAVTWTTAPTVHSYSGGLVAKSPYPPSFTIQNGSTNIFWGAETRDSVYTAPFYITTEGTGTALTTNALNHPAVRVVDGKWQTKIGSTTAYRAQQQWIITTTKNGDISIATNQDFETRYNLTEQQSKAKSSARVGACIMPGFYGHSNSMPWTLVLVYRGSGVDLNLYETYITVG